ncbi:hypothetical protein AAZX31_02G018600 [Glycine max]|nr:hypothetical protein GLYMA_02G019566v4 [Glycine max]KAH1058325.1 hypothetical protein GYH30_002752 [Glycine max]
MYRFKSFLLAVLWSSSERFMLVRGVASVNWTGTHYYKPSYEVFGGTLGFN